jgi:hypothetical protein
MEDCFKSFGGMDVRDFSLSLICNPPKRGWGVFPRKALDKDVARGLCFVRVASPVASIGTVVAYSGAIATTANSGTHSAVTSTLAQLAVTAIAIASGACLSTQVESLLPQNEKSPGNHPWLS